MNAPRRARRLPRPRPPASLFVSCPCPSNEWDLNPPCLVRPTSRRPFAFPPRSHEWINRFGVAGTQSLWSNAHLCVSRRAALALLLALCPGVGSCAIPLGCAPKAGCREVLLGYAEKRSDSSSLRRVVVGLDGRWNGVSSGLTLGYSELGVATCRAAGMPDSRTDADPQASPAITPIAGLDASEDSPAAHGFGLFLVEYPRAPIVGRGALGLDLRAGPGSWGLGLGASRHFVLRLPPEGSRLVHVRYSDGMPGCRELPGPTESTNADF